LSLQLLQNCLMLINTILVEQTIEREGVWERLSAKIFEHRHRCSTDTSIPMDSLPSTSTVRHFSRLPDHLQTASKQMAARLPYPCRQGQLFDASGIWDSSGAWKGENGKTRRSRRRFCAEEKARVVGQYKESGLTRVEFSRREGVSLFNLQRCWESRTDPESALCRG
jgi:hypothetical protein